MLLLLVQFLLKTAAVIVCHQVNSSLIPTKTHILVQRKSNKNCCNAPPSPTLYIAACRLEHTMLKSVFLYFHHDNYHCEVGQSSKKVVKSSASDGECRNNGKIVFFNCMSVIAPSDHLVNARITRRRTRGGLLSRWCCQHKHTLLTPNTTWKLLLLLLLQLILHQRLCHHLNNVYGFSAYWCRLHILPSDTVLFSLLPFSLNALSYSLKHWRQL